MTEMTEITTPTVQLMSKEVRIAFPTGSTFSVRLGDLWELMRVLYIAATPKAHETRHRDYTIHRGRTVVRPAKAGEPPKVTDRRDLVVGRRADRVTLTQGDITETLSRAEALALDTLLSAALRQREDRKAGRTRAKAKRESERHAEAHLIVTAMLGRQGATLH
ncbi:hypothetical protein [Rubellimicrobium roseum]|uniref:Uncharacterized protein n=1 Tax=Rubellimicrobium roseum TaxID=687525 RepID=A0A5C4N6I3_9RHOB|nr:hypothetical protein [Rubellimicrobium roseum]TNC60304.1 hypothetical protein FHG71_22170 [Rubellimicrobium roseum]